MPDHDIVVVGSGINALVCAALLARSGKRVCVLERSSRLGGCIRTDAITEPGFVHDLLSCWHPLFVTSPGYAALKDDLERHGLTYCNTDSPTAVVLPDGEHLILRRDREANVRAMNALHPGDGDAYRQALAALEQDLELTFTLLGGELWTWGTARVFGRALWRRGAFELAKFFGAGMESCRKWLERDFGSAAVQGCLAPWPPHAGFSPDAPLSGHMAKVIAFTLEAAGCPVPQGGGVRLVEALRAIIEAHGGTLSTDCDVETVKLASGRATGVRSADGREFDAAEAIVCCVTPTQLYQRLLPDGEVPPAIIEQAAAFRYGNGDMQIHLALDAPPEWRDPALAQVAVTHLTSGIDGVSQAINQADCGLLPREATVVVGQPAALDPSRVPQGKGLLWIQLQELPRHIKGDAAGEIAAPPDGKWNERVREAYADRIVARLARHITNLDSTVRKRVVFSPADLEAFNINLVGGDPYAGACTLDQMFLWRPLRGLKNHRTPIERLYHIGASTHPGPGLGAGSGFLVAQSLGAR